MKITATNKGYEVGGFWGALIAVPIVCVVFSCLAIMFLSIVAILLSPVILVVWLVVR